MSKPLRIVNIITQMEAGGAQGAAIRVAAELRRRGHEAETWFLYLKRPTYVEHEGVRVLLERQPTKVNSYTYIFNKLIRDIQTFKPDGVITYTHYANVLGQIAALIAGVPARVASQRNPSWSYPKAARYLDQVIGSLGIYTANIAVSHAVYESFNSYPKSYGQRLRIIYNGVSPKESSLDKIEARTKFNLPEQSPLVVNVGRLAHQKNQEVLIKALCLLPAVHLAIAGDGELRESLMQQALDLGVKKRVHFVGEIPPENIPDFLRTGDIFTFPSHFEAFGFALVEAMHVGLPVIASDIPALAEVLSKSSEPVGLLIPPTDDKAWAQAIQQVLADDQLRTTLSSQSQQRAALFSLENMVNGYEQCVTKFKP